MVSDLPELFTHSTPLHTSLSVSYFSLSPLIANYVWGGVDSSMPIENLHIRDRTRLIELLPHMPVLYQQGAF